MSRGWWGETSCLSPGSRVCQNGSTLPSASFMPVPGFPGLPGLEWKAKFPVPGFPSERVSRASRFASRRSIHGHEPALGPSPHAKTVALGEHASKKRTIARNSLPRNALASFHHHFSPKTVSVFLHAGGNAYTHTHTYTHNSITITCCATRTYNASIKKPASCPHGWHRICLQISRRCPQSAGSVGAFAALQAFGEAAICFVEQGGMEVGIINRFHGFGEKGSSQ